MPLSSIIASPGSRKGPAIGIDIFALGNKFFGIGDSIMHGVGADNPSVTGWFYQLATAKGKTVVDASVSGKSLQCVPGFTCFNVTDIVPYEEATEIGGFSAMFFNLATNDLTQGARNGYVWWLGEEAMDNFMDYAINVRGWPPERIVLASPYYLELDHGQPYWNPWYVNDYRAMHRRVAGRWGVIYADIYTWTIDNFETPGDLLGDGVHPNQTGHNAYFDFYNNVLDYRPALPFVQDPNIHYDPYATTATMTASFASLGLNSSNVDYICKRGDFTQRFIPGDGSNTITGFQNGEDYLIVPKFLVGLNRTATSIPGPVTFASDSTSIAASYATASGRSAMQTVIDAFWAGLEEDNLADRCAELYILQTSFAASKYNIRTATATLSEVGGAGTFASDGWTGGTNKGLQSSLSLENLGNEVSMPISVKTNVTEDRFDIGATNTGLYSKHSIYGMYGQYSGGFGWTYPDIDTAIGINCICGHKAPDSSVSPGVDFDQWYHNGIAKNSYIGPITISNIANMIIGNDASFTNGSTKKLRVAGTFRFLHDFEVWKLKNRIADLESLL